MTTTPAAPNPANLPSLKTEDEDDAPALIRPFWPAPEVADLGAILIEQKPYHAKLKQAMEEEVVRVIYLFSDKPQTIRGRQAAATCTLKKGVETFLMGFAAHSARNEERENYEYASLIADDEIDQTPFFLIRTWWDAWQVMEHHERMILTDHELKHGGAEWLTDKDKWRLFVRPHDFEDFHDIAEEWGMWSPDLKELQRRVAIAESRGILSKPEGMF